ncbi:hypothetical protein [Ramlibacter sp.]|uniref:hypothetical protein n=1 Tax=Ramlibacter sp. TaxID=1917967 RepID=UPI002C3E6AB3|nr:hypothetical protein [Ramlibacter sp.]HWI83289.1 hypothetical protein [Ramlibacter sp.]
MKLSWLLRGMAIAGLVAWAAGLGMAAVQLADWERDMVHGLLQLRADRTFRIRMAERGEAIPRDWYRAKALALLAAGDRLEDESRWAAFIPGAWWRADDLRERLAQRVEREFSDLGVETMRRELDYRASQLTGVAQDPATGELRAAGGCGDPALPASFYEPGRAGAASMPELQAVQAHLADVAQLDAAVRAFAELQSGQGDGTEPLRLLVRYTLGAELTGRLSRRAWLLRQGLGPADEARQAVRTARLQQALRCSVAKRMALLDARVFERNDLLAVEAALAPHLAELVRPPAVPRPWPQTLERWQAVIRLVTDQERLLTQSDTAWLAPASPSLGPIHDAVLQRIGGIGLLGPPALAQVQRQSGAALQRLRQQLLRSLGSGADPALRWDGERRLVLSPLRLALRDRLAALIQQPFMAPAADQALPQAAAGALVWNGPQLAAALALREVRHRFVTEQLPEFPAAVRTAVGRVVDRQLALRVEEHAAGALRSMPPEAAWPLDLAAWRAQRQQAGRVQVLLAQLGARDRAEHLRQLLAADVVARLRPAEQALAQTEFASPRLQDFGWWGGEGSPILQALGVADALTLQYVLAQQVTRLEVAARQVGPLLAEARDTDALALRRWQSIVADLDRYRAGRADSSLLRLERTLLELGPQIHAGNCGDKLAGVTVPAGADEFAQRLRQLTGSLGRRCAELRAGARTPPQPPPASIPFG